MVLLRIACVCAQLSSSIKGVENAIAMLSSIQADMLLSMSSQTPTQCISVYSALQDAMPNQFFKTYSSRTAKAAAIAPTLYPTTLAAPVVSVGGALVSVALGATLGPPVCVGTVELPPFVGMAVPVLAAPPPDALNVIMVVTDTVSFGLVSELLHSMLPS
jgi:hypothetical protein